MIQGMPPTLRMVRLRSPRLRKRPGKRKQNNYEMWKYGNVEICKCENVEMVA